MSKHTPGKWQVGPKTRYTVITDQPIESDYIAGINDREAYGGYLIAESVAPENIPLIAAAPALLEAAKAVISDSIMLVSVGCGHCTECGADVLHDPITHTSCSLGALQAAIAQAEGDA